MFGKGPVRPFPSAQALADDLTHFLHGEPLDSRRPGLLVGVFRVISRRRLTLSMGSMPVCFLAALLWLVAHGLIAWLVVKGGAW